MRRQKTTARALRTQRAASAVVAAPAGARRSAPGRESSRSRTAAPLGRARRIPAAALLGFALLVAAAACGEGETVTAQPQIEVSVLAIDFGDVPVLHRKALQVEVRNVGRAPLLIEDVSLEPAEPVFAIESRPESVGPGESGAIELAFAPPRLESFEALLRIRSDDATSPLVEVSVTGRGFTVGAIEVPAGLEFPNVCEGTEEIRRLKVRSTGTADLVLERIAFAEGSAPEFQFLTSTRTPVTVPAGKELLITIRYAPRAGSPPVAEGVVVVESTDPARRRVEVPLSGTMNRAPVAVVGELPISAPGATVTLDGSASSDPDGHAPVSFAWSIQASPIGSTARPSPDDAPQAALSLDLPGEYVVQLEVEDALGCRSPPAFAEVLAKPHEKLVVELVWDKHESDLDLHMVPEGQAFFGPTDCYFAEANMQPDWGELGNPEDDPVLARDALTGFGPEIITYNEPAPGTYRVMSHFYSDHRARDPRTTATVRVYVSGALRSEMRRELPSQGVRWMVLAVDWPSGALTPIDTLE
jgi:hypothetical protein